MTAAATTTPDSVPTALDTVLGQLRTLLGDRLSTSAAVRDHHGRDESFHTPCPPDAVAFVESTEEVAAIVRVCADHRVPIVPFGVGTSIEGHISAIHGGICIDLSRMNAILAIRPDDMDATVQAGVTRKQLNEYLRDTGLFFPIDPGADATLGGMAATRASGTNAVRYGTMREAVLSLTVVTASGEIVHTARRARKSSAGYDLTRLFVGSEGTLGVITEVTVRLHGIPESILSAVCPFPSLRAAVDTVIETIQCGVPIARIELLNTNQIRAVNAYSKTTYDEVPTLFLEFHGSEAHAREQVDMVETIATEHGAQGFLWAETLEERNRLWQARHTAYYAGIALKPGAKAFSSDVCVPISRLAECIDETERELAASSVITTLVGHVGDGNFHVLFIFDPEDAEDIAESKRLTNRIVERALAMEGTCTGEHGVGLGKKSYLAQEHGAEGLALMQAIKQALDPLNIMNPGKIVG